MVKVAGSLDGPSPRDRRTFEAAAIATARVGAPLLTHCEGGTGGVAQLRLLEALGVPLDRVILSHTDKVVDRGYHRELLSGGACVVYDQGIRTPEETTARLVRWMVADGHGPAPARHRRRPAVAVVGARRRPRPGRPPHPPGQAAGRRARPGRPWTASGSPTRPPPWNCARARRAYEFDGAGGAKPGRGRLAGKVCVVTGATGMAADAARRFAAEGAEVWVVARDRDQCEALGLPYALADLRDEGETEAAFAALRRAHPRVDALYAVAGASGRPLGDRPAHELSLAAWEGTLALNATPAFWPPGRRCGPCWTSRPEPLGRPRLAGADVERAGRPPDGAAVRHPRLRPPRRPRSGWSGRWPPTTASTPSGSTRWPRRWCTPMSARAAADPASVAAAGAASP